MMRNIESLMFRVKWLVMSPRSRYAYLWNQTRVQIMVNTQSNLKRY